MYIYATVYTVYETYCTCTVVYDVILCIIYNTILYIHIYIYIYIYVREWMCFTPIIRVLWIVVVRVVVGGGIRSLI